MEWHHESLNPQNSRVMKTTDLSLLTFTDQGARNLKQSPQRATAWRQQIESSGIKVISQLWTAGAYDGVIILNGDEKKVLGALTRLAALGNVQTNSMPAFDVAEFAAVVR